MSIADSNIVSAERGCDITMSDSDIVSRFNEIYDATNKPVLAFITAKCGNTSDINDIFQETYMELYKILNKYGADYIKNGKAYIFRITKHQIAKHYSLLKRLQAFVSMTVKNDENETEEIELSDAEIVSFLTEDSVEDYDLSCGEIVKMAESIK
jgi:RNA polymerase sigma-70 factor (ECF subfamily)